MVRLLMKNEADGNAQGEQCQNGRRVKKCSLGNIIQGHEALPNMLAMIMNVKVCEYILKTISVH